MVHIHIFSGAIKFIQERVPNIQTIDVYENIIIRCIVSYLQSFISIISPISRVCLFAFPVSKVIERGRRIGKILSVLRIQSTVRPVSLERALSPARYEDRDNGDDDAE